MVYVMIVIFLQDSAPRSGFSQEFGSRDACYFAVAQTRKELKLLGAETAEVVMHCVSKPKPQL